MKVELSTVRISQRDHLKSWHFLQGGRKWKEIVLCVLVLCLRAFVI